MTGNGWVVATADKVVAKIAAMVEVLTKEGKVLVAAVVAQAIVAEVTRGKFVVMAVVQSMMEVSAGSGKDLCPQICRLATQS